MLTEKRVVLAGQAGPLDYLAEAHRLRAEAFSQFMAWAVVEIGAQVERLVQKLRAKWRRRTTVDELLALDDRLLADIGLSRHEVLAMDAGLRPTIRQAVADIFVLTPKTAPSSPAPDHADSGHRRAA